MKNFILGTAQFGLSYGVTNSLGQTLYRDIEVIIKNAHELGVWQLDTAQAYGESELQIGKVLKATRLREKFKIITKVDPRSCRSERPLSFLKSALNQSRRRLGEGKISLLLHNAEVFNSGHGKEWGEALIDLKRDSDVVGIGISVYSPEELFKVLTYVTPDLVQCPSSYIDQRFAKCKQVSALVDRGVEFHGRSLFLQGLLLQSIAKLPEYLSNYRDHFKKLENTIEQNTLSPLELCLAWYFSQSHIISKCVIGVNTPAHFSDIAKVFIKDDVKRDYGLDWDSLQLNDERLIDPRLWPKKAN